jgi:hypothetical protein
MMLFFHIYPHISKGAFRILIKTHLLMLSENSRVFFYLKFILSNSKGCHIKKQSKVINM